MTAPEQIRVGGVNGAWLNDIAAWGDLSYSTSWGNGGGGCDEMSWSMNLAPLVRSSVLATGKVVELFSGSTRTWFGTLGQVDWSTGEITADGIKKRASAFVARDGSGNTTAVPTTAVDTALGGGLEWAGRSGLPSSAISAASTTNDANKLNVLLDAASDFTGQFWSVFEDGIVTMRAADTTPTWQVAPGIVDLGDDNAEFASALVVRYLDSGTSTYATITVVDAAAASAYGYVEEPVLLTQYGAMTTAKATTFANGILAKGRSRLGWTNDITVSPYQLTTMGGLPADLSMVRAGQMFRAWGIYDPLNLTPYRDLVIGKAARTVADGTITLSPVDTQPQTLADVTEAVMRAATNQTFRA